MAQKVSGSSFLGLGTEPADSRSVSYLLEEDEPPEHRGRNLILIVLIIVAGAAGWYWRQDLRGVASKLLSSPPPAGSSGGAGQDANSATPAAPGATSVAPANGVSTDNQVQQPAQVPPGPATSGAADSNQSPPAGQPQAGQPQAGQSAADQSAADQSAVDQSQANQSQANQSGSSNPSHPSNSAASTAVAKPDDSADAGGSQAAPGRKAVKVRAQSPVADLEAEGEKYLYGNGVPENCTRARKSLLAAAQRSSAQAQSVLGTMYATGHCATRDLPTAYRWFSRSLRKDPSNTRIEQDLKVLWNQMTPGERQLALRDER